MPPIEPEPTPTNPDPNPIATPPAPADDPPTELEAPAAPARGPRTHEPQDPTPTVAVARTDPDRLARALANARHCARIADENRGRDILLLDLREATPLVDYFVIATAVSRRQAAAIAFEIDAEMKRRSEYKLGMEGSEEGRWILIDYGDFVVHVFSEDARTYYDLEGIWGDAPRLDWQEGDEARPAAAGA